MDIGVLSGRLTLEDEASVALKTFTGHLSDIGTSLTRAGTTLTIGLTAPLVAAAGASLLFSGNFEASMTRLVSLAGVSQDELAGVKEHILDLAPAVGIGPQALADAMTKVSSTVSDTNKAMAILDTSAKLSAAGMGTAVDVAGALTAVLNSYAGTGLTAARAADILTQSVKDGGAEAKELAPVLANVVPIAAQLGVGFEEVGANIATLTKLGVPAAEAVTQLSSVFSAMLKETKQGTEALTSVGMSYAGLRAEIKEKGLAETLIHLSTVFKGNETALTDVFGRIEALRNVMSTAGVQAGTYREVLDNVKRSSDGLGVATAAYDAMQHTQLKTWSEVTAAVQVAAIRLGDALAPAMGKVLDIVLPLTVKLGDLAKWFGSLPAPVQNTAIVIGALAAAAGPLVYIVGTLVSSFVALVPLMVPLGAAFAILTGPIGAVALAVTGLVAAVVIFRGHMRDIEKESTIGKPLNDLKDAAGNAIVPIQNVDDAMKKAGATASGDLANGMTLTIGSLKTQAEASTAAAGATNALTDMNKTLADQLKSAESEISRMSASTKDQLVTAIRSGAFEMKDLQKASGLSETALKMFTSRLSPATKEVNSLAKELQAISVKWKDQARDVGSLSDTQKTSIDRHIELGHKVEDIATVMHVSKDAVADYKSELDHVPARTKAIADEADRLRPKLEVMGFEEARKHAILFHDALIDTGEAAQETGSDLADIVVPSVLAAKGEFKDITPTVKDFGDSLGDLANDFVQMAQIAGDSWGGPLRAIGQIIKSVQQVAKGIEQVGDAMASIDAEGFNASNLTALAAGWVGIASAVVGGLMAWADARQEQFAIENELIRIGIVQKEWSTDIQFTNKVLDVAGERYKQVAQIVQELGGVAALSKEQYHMLFAEMADAIAIVAGKGVHSQRAYQDALILTNKYLAEMGQAAIDAGQLVSGEFITLVKFARQQGADIKSLNEFFLTQLGSAAKGLNSLLGGLQAAATASARAQVKALGILTDEAIAKISGTFIVTQDQGAGLAAAVVADFASMVDAGATFKEALEAIQPSITALSVSLTASGVDGGAAFKLLTDLSAIAANEVTGPLLDAISGANDALKGLHNSGVLNQDMFGALTLTATEAFNKIIAEGGNGNAALMAIAPTLQTIWSLQKDFGYEVDSATQALLDEAVAHGLVGDAHRPVAEQMLKLTERMTTAIEGLATVFGVVLPNQAVSGMARVQAELNRIHTPSIPAPWASWGPPPTVAADDYGDSGSSGRMSFDSALGSRADTLLRGPWTTSARSAPTSGDVRAIEGMNRISMEAMRQNERSDVHDKQVYDEIHRMREEFMTRMPNLIRTAMKDAKLAS